MDIDITISTLLNEDKGLRNFLAQFHPKVLSDLKNEFPDASVAFEPMRAGPQQGTDLKAPAAKLLEDSLPLMRIDLEKFIRARQSSLSSSTRVQVGYEISVLAGSTITIGGVALQQSLDKALIPVVLLGGGWTFLTGAFAIYQRLIVNPRKLTDTDSVSKALSLWGDVNLLISEYEIIKSDLSDEDLMEFLKNGSSIANEVSLFLLAQPKM